MCEMTISLPIFMGEMVICSHNKEQFPSFFNISPNRTGQKGIWTRVFLKAREKMVGSIKLSSQKKIEVNLVPNG